MRLAEFAPPRIPRPVVTIIDDDADARDEVAEVVENCGFHARMLKGPYGPDIDRLLRDAVATNYVICDQRLSHHGSYLQKEGSDVVQMLWQKRVPTILVTEYTDADREKFERMNLRHRFSKDDIQADNLKKIFDDCRKDIFESRPPSERLYRTIIRVVNEPQGRAFSAIVPRWSDDSVVDISLDAVPEELLRFIKPAATLFGYVNLNAASKEALVFRDFELAPELDPHDGLA